MKLAARPICKSRPLFSMTNSGTAMDTVVESEELTKRLASERDTVVEVWQHMRAQLEEVSLTHLLPELPPDPSRSEIRRDPFDGTESLHIDWQDAHGQPVGNLVIHAAGSIFAEYDVVQAHPTKSRWFIEAVSAWGKRGAVSAELRLLPTVG